MEAGDLGYSHRGGGECIAGAMATGLQTPARVYSDTDRASAWHPICRDFAAAWLQQFCGQCPAVGRARYQCSYFSNQLSRESSEPWSAVQFLVRPDFACGWLDLASRPVRHECA